MKVYCLNRFKQEFLKLSSKKHYKTLEADIIEHFINKSLAEVQSGRRLNNSVETPYVKKRLNGAGGFRVYFFLIIKDEALYLMFVHPKTGPDGSDNVTDESKAILLKEVVAAIKDKDLHQVEQKESKLVFTHLSEVNKD